MVVSATISTSPTLIYFGQEVGEPGAEDAGFGKPSRTSIFDYIGVPRHQRWMNGGKFDGGMLTPDENALRNFYQHLLNFTISSPALTGAYADLQTYNRKHNPDYAKDVYAFVRWNGKQKLIIICNFSNTSTYNGSVLLSPDVAGRWQLRSGNYPVQDQLAGSNKSVVQVGKQTSIPVVLQPLKSVIYALH